MANPIQKNDLISDDALRALEEMSRLLREDKENMDALMASFKQYAGSIQTATTANSGNNDALAAALQKVSELEKAYSELQKAMKENTNAQKAVNEEKRKYKKLTEDEIRAVEDLKRALAGTAQEQIKATQTIDIQSKSYNELYQTYNALKDALNAMTLAERQNSDAGKAMVARSKEIYDTLNSLQQATGKYTLNVGNYQSAFSRLQFQAQQLMREAPSAISLQQFFLAISNNLPMFTDALTNFKAATKDMKARLKEVTEEMNALKKSMEGMEEGSEAFEDAKEKLGDLTEEQKNLKGQSMGTGKALVKSIVSWQTAILVGIMLLQKFGSKIVDMFANIFKGTKKAIDETKLYDEMNEQAASSVGEMTAKFQSLRKEWQGLKQEDQGEWLKQHKDDWNELGISIVNVTDAENLYVKNTSIIQNAIDARARSIAAMKLAADKYEEAFKKQMQAEQDLKNRKSSFGSQVARGLAGAGMAEGTGYLTPEQMAFQQRSEEQAIQSYYDNAMKEVKKLQDEAQYYITNWVLPGQTGGSTTTTPKTPKASEPSEQDITERYWEAERALLNALEEGMQKEIEISDWERRKNKDEQDKWYAEQLAALEENVKNGFTTREQADKEALELQRQYNALQEDEDRQHNERVVKIQMDAYRKQLAIREELHKKEMQAIVETSKADTVHVQRRVRNATQEANKNAALATNIEHLVEARKKLLAVEIAMDENKSIEERIKLLEQLNKQIERYASQISITQKIRQYGSVSDMLGTFIGGRVGGQGKENLISNILGEDAMKARIAGFQADNPDGWEKDYMDWLDGEFEEWGKQAMSAATTWYSTTMGYINDLISAYVELANAKAEAAAEATEAAQEEYDKEKALLEAGYASRVEATWAEYQEKKAAQEKAEADAKAAAKAQQELNEVETMGSLIVASANIWKTFSKIPTVGVPLALAALATMWGSFLQAKVKAAEVSKYGEGGFEVLEGGSHASGHDIDLGVSNRRGRRMRAEGKEGLGIFSRRAMNHYGANNIEAMVNSVNRLEFEGNAAKRMSLERSVGMAVLSAPRTDLHRVESDLHKLVGYGSRSRTVNADGSVTEIRKNAKIVYKNGLH